MKQKFILSMFLIISLSIFSKDKLTIGIVYDGLIGTSGTLDSEFKKELKNILGNDYEIYIPKEKQVIIDPKNKNNFSEEIKKLAQDKSVDLVIAEGIASKETIAKVNNFSKPIFYPFFIKEKGFKSSELKNQIEKLKQIKDFEKITIVTEENLSEMFSEIENERDFEIINLGNENEEDLYSKIKNSKALLFITSGNSDYKKIKKLTDFSNENNIPCFSFVSMDNPKINVFGGYSYEKDLKNRIRETALNIFQYLKGEGLNTFSSDLELSKPELFINIKKLEKTGNWPGWEILSQAKWINEGIIDTQEFQIGLKELIRITLENNSKINELKKETKASQLNIEKAKSEYKPDLNFEAAAQIIDRDRAESILTSAEKTLNAGVNLTQVVFNEDISMNIDIQKKKLNIRKEELKKAELDLILEVSEAYISSLKAKTYVDIVEKNLELTKENLELAKAKKNTGVSGQADIYRLESEFAKNLSSYTEAVANLEMSMTNLKRIANYDFSKNLEIKDIRLDDKDFITGNPEILNYFLNKNNMRDLDNLTEYLLNQSIHNSNDLKNIDYGIDIQERVIKSNSNKKFMPTVALQANYTISNIISEGVGSKTPDLSSIGTIADTNTQMAMMQLVNLFGNPNEFNWTISLGIKLPIYSGGELRTDKEIAKNSIEVLNYQKESLLDYMRQQVKNSLIQLIVQYSNIKSAEVSVDSSSKALNLVRDTYTNGISTVSDLISAQTSLFSSKQYKSTIIYDLILSVMRTERITGDYYILKSDEEKENVLQQLKTKGEIK